MKRVVNIGLSILFAANLVFAQNDRAEVLPFETYMNLVRKNHPLAKQAALQLSKGNAELLASKGLFDPKFFTKVTQKYFDGSQYYSRMNGGLKVPTWFGIELKSGYEQNQGPYLNPEKSTPGEGLWYAGISFPLGQGLFIDERRAALKKAQVLLDISEVERQLMLNELLFDAGKAYWGWFESYHKLAVHENALALAEERFGAVKQSALLGDRPYIDTLEAGIQVQNRLLILQQARLTYDNATALLNIYLWGEGVVPLEIAEETIPEVMEGLSSVTVDLSYYGLLDSLVDKHPKLQQYGYEIEQLQVDKRWKQEQLKPVLNLEYNPITEPANDGLLANYSVNNYTWGLNFSMPVFLRKERGELKLTNLKIREKQLNANSITASLSYRARASLNQWNTILEQVALYTQTVRDYRRLLEGERELFNTGESSLFLVNSRELGYINARVKLIELLAKTERRNSRRIMFLEYCGAGS